MQDWNAQVGWTDGQWSRVQQAINEEANRARVCGSFLPLYGPLPSNVKTVPLERVCLPSAALISASVTSSIPVEQGLSIDSASSIEIIEVSIRFALDPQQVSDDELSSALLAFRRAANILARMEDWIAFNGAPRKDSSLSDGTSGTIRALTSQSAYLPPEVVFPRPEPDMIPWIWKIANPSGTSAKGLLFWPGVQTRSFDLTPESLVPEVAEAITMLEGKGHLGPFACVLSSSAFVQANRPLSGSVVLARDHIVPLLGSDVLRSSTIPPTSDIVRRTVQKDGLHGFHGIVISLGGAPVDLVMATDMTGQFVTVSDDPKFIFRVYERFVLRVKDPTAVVTLQTRPDSEPVVPGAPGNVDTVKALKSTGRRRQGGKG